MKSEIGLSFQRLEEISKQYGLAFFTLSDEKLRHNFLSLTNSFKNYYRNFHIGYSYKTNYTPAICKLIQELGGYAEVVSEMEFELARTLKVPYERIIFNGPFKTEKAFVEAAINGSLINVDSVRDVELLTRVSQNAENRNISVLIRCNFDLDNDHISRFGMDVDSDEFISAVQVINALPNVKLKGLHCHFPHRDLRSFQTRSIKMVQLINKIFIDELPEIIDIGGGFYSNMPSQMKTKLLSPHVSFEEYGKAIGTILNSEFSGRGLLPKLFIEPGTALVADIMSFYSKIISTKSIKHKNFATTSGSIFDISPYARSKQLPCQILSGTSPQSEKQIWDICGYTCIEDDIMSKNFSGSINVGDWVRFDNVGSYSIVMKPPFISPSNPILSLSEENITVLKDRENQVDIFKKFKC